MYVASEKRYEAMKYNRCGRSGLMLPAVSLGLWHNFGDTGVYSNMEQLCFTACDNGITHFDLANNYGPEPGSAEKNFGRILRENFLPYRDEMIISTKAGYTMWEGPYGDWGSRKYLLASLDQSLMRMGLDYVDIFYHHRMDPNTPLEETMGALSDIVRSGKALYVGISKYSAAQTRAAAEILARNGTPLLIHQFRYNMFTRGIEGDGLLDALEEVGAGGICFSPLAQGLLTSRYLAGIPSDSRAAKNVFLKSSDITPERRAQLLRLDAFAKARGLTLSELALKWNLRDPRVTSVLIGASRVGQLEENLGFLSKPDLSSADLEELEGLL